MSTKTYTDAASANKALLSLYESAANDECHVTGGRVRLQTLLPGTQLTVYMMQPDASANSTDDVGTLKGGGPFYTAAFLKELANLAGINTVEHHRIDDRSDQHVYEAEVVVEWTTLFMERRRKAGAYMLDVRDGSERAKTATSGDLASQRKHIATRAMTGAETRAIAGALDIRRGFQKVDGGLIAKPIYIPRIRPCLETAPPALMAEMSRMAVANLYGMAPPAPVAAPPPAPTPEPDFGGDSEPDFQDDPVPFDEGESWDAPPPDDDRPINEAEHAYLKELGMSGRTLMQECGWDGQKPVRVSVYRVAVDKFGGAGQ